MNTRRIAQRWLLWLAFLLPLAQAVAGVHALSHATGERQRDSVAHLVHCDLCLTAADLAGSAPAAEASPLPASPLAEVLAAVPPPAASPRMADWRPPARAPPASA